MTSIVPLRELCTSRYDVIGLSYVGCDVVTWREIRLIVFEMTQINSKWESGS